MRYINSRFTYFSFSFRLGWAVCAAQRLRPQHGSISHPQKIPSKYWVLKVRGRSSKKHNHPRSRAHIYWSLIGSRRSNQTIIQPLKRRGTARFNIGSMGSTGPLVGNCLIRAILLGRQAAMRSLASTHPQCKSQPTGARESPRGASERPRPKESQSPERPRLNSVSTDNPMDGEHPSSPRKPPPHLGRPEATPEMWKPAHTTDRRQSQPTSANSYP